MDISRFIVRLTIGLFFIFLGLSLFLDQLGFVNSFWSTVFNLWPLLLVIWGILFLIKRKLVAALFLLFFGVAFLLSNFFNISICSVWPLLIIIVGLLVLIRPGRQWNWENFGKVTNVKRDSINESVVFWSYNEAVKSDNFVGGKIDCIFGGFKLDLREAKISKESAFLEVNCVFGGGELILPKNVRLDTDFSSVMGGVTNKATTSTKSTDPLLRIKAAAVFGGIAIKN